MRDLWIFFMPLLLLLGGCKKQETNAPLSPTESHLQYFGFVMIDTFWDDPTDTTSQTNYAEEINSFSNVADLLVLGPTEDITPRLEYFGSLDLKAVIHLSYLLFEEVGTNSPSGVQYALRDDYQSTWNQWVSNNNLAQLQSHIAAFYVGEEPTWMGIPFEELNEVSIFLKAQFPDIPILIIEAHSALQDLQVPTAVDWIGFDHYFIKNPLTNTQYQEEWNLLKSKRSSPHQRIAVVMDSHYIEWAHGDFGNIALNEMGEVATNYYQLAKNDPSTIAILGYFWPNSFDFPESVGARGMPQSVKNQYVQMGKEITGKP